MQLVADYRRVVWPAMDFESGSESAQRLETDPETPLLVGVVSLRRDEGNSHGDEVGEADRGPVVREQQGSSLAPRPKREPELGRALVVGVLQDLHDPVELVDIQILGGLLGPLDRLAIDARRLLALQPAELLDCRVGKRLLERIVDLGTSQAIDVQFPGGTPPLVCKSRPVHSWLHLMSPARYIATIRAVRRPVVPAGRADSRKPRRAPRGRANAGTGDAVRPIDSRVAASALNAVRERADRPGRRRYNRHRVARADAWRLNKFPLHAAGRYRGWQPRLSQIKQMRCPPPAAAGTERTKPRHRISPQALNSQGFIATTSHGLRARSRDGSR